MAKVTVLPAPPANDGFEPGKRNKPVELTLVWDHRWEYDKALEIFFQALRLFLERNLPFRVHGLGQAFRSVPVLFDEMRVLLRKQLGQWGKVEDREVYRRLLHQALMPVSSVRHDLQGLAVMEAVATRCISVVPDRLAYPDGRANTYRYTTTPENSEQEAQLLADNLATLALLFENKQLLPVPEISLF